MTNPLTKSKMKSFDWLVLYAHVIAVTYLITNFTIKYTMFCAISGAIFFVLYIKLANVHNRQYKIVENEGEN